MALIIGGPKFQAFDTNGDPLSGGLVWTYISGTTTLKATYPSLTDAKNGTNANTNPIVLNSRGEADITTAGSTKLILENPPVSPATHGSVIWTKDDVDTSSTDIFDPNGNEVLKFNYVASAVNEWTMTNAVVGTGPILEATGGDSNIGINIKSKSGGEVVVTSGINGTQLTSAGTTTITSATNNLTATANTTITVGAGNEINFVKGATTTTLTNLTDRLLAATQAEQEAGASLTVGTTPGRQHFHPSAAKVWVRISAAGDAAVGSYNVSSITDGGVGIPTVNFSVAFSAATYGCLANAIDTGNPFFVKVSSAGSSSSSALRSHNTAGTANDPSHGYNFVAYGDQ